MTCNFTLVNNETQLKVTIGESFVINIPSMSDLRVTKEEIKTKLNLSEVVGSKVKLQKAGREFKACCPFHNEKSPSFYVNDDKQFYHCFGCGAHGDHFTFVMEQDKLSFIDAMKRLAEQAGVTMPEPKDFDVEADNKRQRLYEVNNEAALMFESLLHTSANHDVLEYITARGMKDEIIRNFRLGYAPTDGGFLIQYLSEKGFSNEEMIESGLARESNGRVYSFFRDRVMFPVADRRGRVIAFGGRNLPEHIRAPNEKAPKYLNTSDTPLFNKSATLYAQALARQAAVDDEPLIVVEGYTDVIALHQHGFKGAVAPLGTALTEGQIELLWKMDHHNIKEPILAFDGDKAGRAAAIRAMDRALPLLKAGHSLKFLFLPDGDDPDTLLLRNGAPAMRQLLRNAISLADFAWDTWHAQMRLDTPEAKAQAKQYLRENLNNISDPELRNAYREDLEGRLYKLTAPQRNTYQKFQKGNFQKFGQKKKTGGTALPTQGMHNNVALLDRALIASLIQSPQLIEHVEETLGIMDISDSSLDKLRQMIISEGLTWASFSMGEARAYCELKGFGKLVTDTLNEKILSHTMFTNDSDIAYVAQGWTDLYTIKTSARANMNTRTNNMMDRLSRLSKIQAKESANESNNDTNNEEVL